MSGTIICELNEVEMLAIAGGDYEKGTGDLSVSCCSVSVFGFEISLDLGTFTTSLDSDYAAREGERQQEIGITQAGR